jgi:hypothetical protein
MDITVLSGDGAGILFRITGGNAYEFEVGKGDFAVLVWYNGSIVNELISTQSSPAVHGLNQVNHLLVIAKGNILKFFINGVFVGEAQDSVVPGPGIIGMSLEYAPNSAARYANLAVYQA